MISTILLVITEWIMKWPEADDLREFDAISDQLHFQHLYITEKFRRSKNKYSISFLWSQYLKWKFLIYHQVNWYRNLFQFWVDWFNHNSVIHKIGRKIRGKRKNTIPLKFASVILFVFNTDSMVNAPKMDPSVGCTCFSTSDSFSNCWYSWVKHKAFMQTTSTFIRP